ncbi:hypothetical protein [Micromonospora chalcea]|uniref:hypothetical protein n=1 Tax=Micromonospora chalcea TaxID=1874 RepID=UPI0038213165
MAKREAVNTAPAYRIEDLSIRGEIATGGQGTVHALRSGRLVFKEYRPSTVPTVDVNVLQRLVSFYEEAPAEVRAWLNARTAWPVGVVTGPGGPIGFLMPLAPERFFTTLRTASGERRIALRLEHLLNPPEYLWRVGIEVSDRERLLVLRDLARTMDGLHHHDIAVGDLSPRNVLVDTGHEPRCFLLDCDSVRFRGMSVAPQVETPDWTLPAGEPPGGPAGDRYKFGLVALRALAGDQSTRDLSLIAETFPRVTAMVVRALADDPASRPLLSAWEKELTSEIARASRTPPPPRPDAIPPASAQPGQGAETSGEPGTDIDRSDRRAVPPRRPRPPHSLTVWLCVLELLLLLAVLR